MNNTPDSHPTVPGGAWSAPRHALKRMTGRSSDEHRSATPLELLFDLAFVAAFAVAGKEMTHLLELGHFASAIGAFAFVMFAIVWAWINFTWFASAFDTDDWFYRLTTMVQMTGVVILALGIAPVFASIDEGQGVDNRVMVGGYVVMRLAMVSQWLRVAIQAREYRSTALTYAACLSAAQAGWIILAALPLSLSQLIVPAVLLYLVELGGPVLAETRIKATPWHPHHIAERYGLLAIITIGEGVLGTVAAVQPMTATHGWSLDAVALVAGGIALSFSLWWTYFTIPFGDALEASESAGRSAFAFGYGHMLVFAGLAATGAGLHVIAYVVEGVAHISSAQAMMCVTVPVALVLVSLLLIYAVVMQHLQPFYLALFSVAVAILLGVQFMAAAGFPFALCILLTAMSPGIVVAGQELLGHRHTVNHLSRLQRG